ncbi:MAG: rhomboid family intramembrane serine protease [Oscillibacter sp.]|nr:rhomboid family intramembrane serine protease [Oscillibacter sp.]
MKKLSDAVDRFCYSHPRFGIPNLMRYIVIGNVLVYLLSVFSSAGAVSFLAFNWDLVLHGEIWRLVTFPFISGYSSLGDILFLALFLYFYYWMGSVLEREWGSAKFTLYYLSGLVLTLLTAIIVSIATGHSIYLYGTDYVNLSMFFAFAMLYPDAQVLLFFIIPVKIKWMAWFDAAFFALSSVQSLIGGDILGALLPVIAIANFFVFFWSDISERLGRQKNYVRHQNSHQTIQFKSAVKQEAKKAREQGYRHKCCVCGRTDTEFPDLQFRYCSKCAGYHCFCEDHIYNHVHFTDEK